MSQSSATALAQSASVTTEATFVTADPNFRNDLVSLFISQSAAGTVTIRNTTGGTAIIAVVFAGAGTQFFQFPVPLQGASQNTNWTAQASAGTASVIGFFVKGV
jgi:hypothetical protein